MQPNALKAYYERQLNKKETESFYSLIDRMQKCSEIKYPNRLWSNDVYYSIAFAWMGKEKELEERVLKLESELTNN